MDRRKAWKSLPRLDRYARDYIARSPFLCIATSGEGGRADVSPRGDQPGFVQVLDDHALAIPDRPGNNRLDTMENILVNPNVGLIFMIPGSEDTLRINGKATITADPAILARATVDRKQPKVAIRVAAEEAFFHCARAFRRSRLWQPDAIVDRRAMPTLARIILEQTAAAAAARRGRCCLRRRARRRLQDTALLRFAMTRFAFLALALIATPVAADTAHHGQHTPYAGLETRGIKALSAEEIGDLEAGRGMGLALAAELNGYPGPRHVLDLADPLRLTPEQRHRTGALFGAMQRETSALGRRLIEAERALDRLFAENRATPESVSVATATAGALEGELRAAHLRYHLAMMDVLTPEQIAEYNRLRGYTQH